MQAYGQTDTGCVRTRNQDYIYFSPEQTGDLENLFFLADGMGGYQAGDYASWYAVEELVRYMKEQKGVPLVKRFQEGISSCSFMTSPTVAMAANSRSSIHSCSGIPRSS